MKQPSEADPLPSDWQMLSLGDLTTVAKAGGTPRRAVERYWNGNIPFAKIEDISRSRGFLSETAEFITGEGLENSSAWVVPKGSVVLTMYGTIGLPALVTRPLATNQAIIALIPNEAVDPLFLLFALKRWGRDLERFNVQSTQKNIGAGIVRSFALPVPPIPEQRAIAHVLRTVQRAREATEQVIAAAKELKRSLVRHLFTYGPVPPSSALSVLTRDTEAGPVPASWTVGTLVDVAASPKGAIVSGPFGSNIGKRFFVDQGVPLIRGNNLAKGDTLFRDEGFVFITEVKAQELRNCEATRGDLLFTGAGTIGQVGLIPPDSRFEKYIISNKQLRARVNASIVDPRFLFHWFTHDRIQWLFAARRRGTSIPTMNLGTLRSMPIPIPDLATQAVVLGSIETIEMKIGSEMQLRHALDTLYSSLMSELMSGRRRISSDLFAQVA